ncbi:MAG: CDGSH-type Zn-finger protein [Paraglaciecola sp.]|jgi:CDGSH-type Zn-finger protein
MTKALIANNKPVKITLQEGKNYFYCTCGRSSAQPFCDGSHKGTGMAPQKVCPDETYEAFLCVCKHSSNQPFCDGSHKEFTDKQVGGCNE